MEESSVGRPSYQLRALAMEDAVAPTIWLVDDSPLQGEVSRLALLRRHRVVLFDRAAPMLERLSSGDRPDILVLDWHMPDVSGLEACRFVRTVADGAELPIIVLTATGDHQDLIDGLGAGANDFVKKPVDEAEMNARISSLVRTKRLHARLAATEWALREEASFRERFLAILAHDLRQPLNMFSMGSELMAAPDTSQAARDKLGVLFTSATARMKRMIEELLDFSRSRPQGGGMPVVLAPVDLGALLRSIVEEVRLEHPTRTITLDLGVSSNGAWDQDRMAQVISNLLENALSHSAPDSPVTVALTSAPGGVAVTVENHGEPLTPELLGTLFDPFRRRRSPTAKDRGLGLGLYIVDQIVKAHGGAIEVESSEGRIRFRVVLPFAPVDVESLPRGAPLAPLILVVDDNEDASAICVGTLRREGFRVEHASDGLEALAKIAQARPDLVFMDLAMPKMDGWEATRLIKEDPLTRGIVVVVLTGHSTPRALERARAAGAAQVSHRPCSSEEILALVRKHVVVKAA